MEDFASDEKFDVALCVFTVLLYLLDDAALTNAAAAVHRSLKLGGRLLVDIPSRALFQGYSRSDHLIDRSVSVTQRSSETYTYQENLAVNGPNSKVSKYQDTFSIKYWPQDAVISVFEGAGFVLDADVSNHFAGAGASYHLMKKAN